MGALKERGVAEVDAEELVADLERSGLVSDTRAASTRAAHLAERGWGNAVIDHRLEAASYSLEARAAALASLNGEVDRARLLLARKRRAPAAAARFLAQRGFDDDVCEGLLGTEEFSEG